MTTEHIKTSIGRMSVKGTLPCRAGAGEQTCASECEDKEEGTGYLSGGGVEAEGVAEFLFRDCAGGVNLVAEDEERDLAQLFDGEEGVEFGFRLVEAFRVLGVDEKDDAVDLGEVVLPEAARLLVPSEVVRRELDVADREFFRGRVQGRLEGREAVVLEHVEEGRLAGIVEAEEEDLCVLVDEAKAGEDVPEVAKDAREEGPACRYAQSVFATSGRRETGSRHGHLRVAGED